MEPSVSLGKFRFLPNSVRIKGKPPIDDWAGPFQFALWCQRASPWWIGDMLNAGDAQFGEMFSQVCEGHVSAEMLQRYESVARRVPAENRRDDLSWSSHAAVARLPYDEQRKMLAKADANGWNSTQIQKEVRTLCQRLKISR